MKFIDTITPDAKQLMYLEISEFDLAKFQIEFKPNQEGWFFNLEYGNFAIYNQRITSTPNMLRQFRNLLPFGLMCITNNLVDPITLQAFEANDAGGNAEIYILTSDEVANLEAEVYVV